MEGERELTEFQKEFREKQLADALKSQDVIPDDNDEEVDTQAGRYMTFQCGEEYYGIAIPYVNEIIGIQPIAELPDTPDFVKGLINLRGKIIPILDMRIRFNKEEVPYNDRTCVIVITVGEDVVGLIVDTIAEVVSIADEDILAPPSASRGNAQAKFIKGLGKVGDQVKLILDPTRLIYDQSAENVG